MSDIILQTRQLAKEFKGFTAVSKVNLSVVRGSIHALIGPCRTCTGVLQARSS